MSLNNLSVRLGKLGQGAAALLAAQEAVEVHRALTRQNPEAFNPLLAISLNNLGNRLSELGRWREALAPAQEAVAIRRELARQHSGVFNSALANSLNNLANRLIDLGRTPEALVLAKEAVELDRKTCLNHRPFPPRATPRTRVLRREHNRSRLEIRYLGPRWSRTPPGADFCQKPCSPGLTEQSVG